MRSSPKPPSGLEFRMSWPAGPALVREYLSATPTAVGFYDAHFLDADAYRSRAESVDARFDRAARERAVRALRVSGDAARTKLAAWTNQAGYAVTTGQQPGLLTGPLYSVYKALTAVHLARVLEQQLDKPVLPVFWVASEDHDWAESGHTFVLDRTNQLRRIEAVPAAPPEERALFRVDLSESEEPWDRLERLLPRTPYSERWAASARRAYAGSNLAEGMAALLLELLGPLGLCVCVAHDPAIKRASEAVLLGELEQGAEHQARLEAQCSALTQAGYGIQVPVLDGALNLFMEGPSQARERLYRTGTGVRLHKSGVQVSQDSVREAIRAGQVSPNVLLRPVAESAAFPTLAYVGGPGELAYFAELSPLFRSYGMQMPVLHPRASATVIDPKIRRVLDKFSLTPGELAVPSHELASRWAKEEMPETVLDALSKMEESIATDSDALADAALPIDATLQGPVTRARNAALAAVTHARGKILTAIKRRGAVSLAQLARAQTALQPGGSAQDRTLSVYSFLSRYGDDFVHELNDHVAHHVEVVHGTAPVS